MTTNFDVGDVAHLRISFVNSAGTPVDPSSVSLQYRNRAADPRSYVELAYNNVSSLVRDSAGEYYYDLPINSGQLGTLVNSGSSLGGAWVYRGNGTGSNAGAVEAMFNVNHRIVG